MKKEGTHKKKTSEQRASQKSPSSSSGWVRFNKMSATRPAPRAENPCVTCRSLGPCGIHRLLCWSLSNLWVFLPTRAMFTCSCKFNNNKQTIQQQLTYGVLIFWKRMKNRDINLTKSSQPKLRRPPRHPGAASRCGFCRWKDIAPPKLLSRSQKVIFHSVMVGLRLCGGS